MERSIKLLMAELEPIKGYNRTKTAISQEQLLRTILFTKACNISPSLSIFLNKPFTSS